MTRLAALAPIDTAIAAQPFLKWAGGKGRLLAQYQPLFPAQFKTYYEPFLGGGAVFFRLTPPRAQLSDINTALVNVYQSVQHDVETLIDRLRQHQQRHGQDYYYAVRSQHDLTGVAQAARLIYLNKTCFNGLYRENSKGQFNVPMGRYKKPAICNPDLLYAASAALQNTRIQVAGFADVLSQAVAGDFVYFDPPYHPISDTSCFTAYSKFAFREAEQRQLREVFGELCDRGVQVMLSNSDCDLIRALYRDFPIHPIWAARAINSKAKRRGKIPEVLVTSYPVEP